MQAFLNTFFIFFYFPQKFPFSLYILFLILDKYYILRYNIHVTYNEVFRLFDKDVKNVKRAKPFLRADILVYLSLVLTVFLLFLAFFPNKGSNVYGFDFYVGNDLAATYRFENQTFSVTDGYENSVVTDGGVIYFYFNEERSEYNAIVIDAAEKSAKVMSSTCNGHDCEQTKISADGGFIYCAPHKLKVVTAGKGNYSDPITG